jgi:radical SAM protein with 4Fe4S-binding SPASM domain
MTEKAHNKIENIYKNIFLLNKNDVSILFNRINFQREYFYGASYSQLREKAKKMEKLTPKIKFRMPKCKKVRLEVTLKCNCKCDYCLVYENCLEQIDSSMSKTVALKIISLYKKNIKNGSLMIIGSEPLLNWPVVRLFIEKIKDPIKIFTNGTIMDQEILDSLKANEHVSLMISLDGKRKNNKHRKFTGGKEVYPAVLKNIKLLQKNKCKIGINCLCTDENVGELYESVIFFVHDLKIKNIGISFPHYIESNKEAINDFNIEKYAEEIKKIFDYSLKEKFYVDQLSKRFSPLIKKEFRLYSCKLLGEQQTFYPDGRKTLCTKIDSIKNKKSSFGVDYFKKLIPVNNKYCSGCPAMGMCGGGCFWDGFKRFRHGVDERECVLNKSLLEHFISAIYEKEKKNKNLKEEFEFLVR